MHKHVWTFRVTKPSSKFSDFQLPYFYHFSCTRLNKTPIKNEEYYRFYVLRYQSSSWLANRVVKCNRFQRSTETLHILQIHRDYRTKTLHTQTRVFHNIFKSFMCFLYIFTLPFDITTILHILFSRCGSYINFISDFRFKVRCTLGGHILHVMWREWAKVGITFSFSVSRGAWYPNETYGNFCFPIFHIHKFIHLIYNSFFCAEYFRNTRHL